MKPYRGLEHGRFRRYLRLLKSRLKLGKCPGQLRGHRQTPVALATVRQTLYTPCTQSDTVQCTVPDSVAPLFVPFKDHIHARPKFVTDFSTASPASACPSQPRAVKPSCIMFSHRHHEPSILPFQEGRVASSSAVAGVWGEIVAT
jgi:hypothetical protein